MANYLAFDLGAESGRAVIITLKEQKVTFEQIHRFPNRPTPLAGTLYWDFYFLFAEIAVVLTDETAVLGIGVPVIQPAVNHAGTHPFATGTVACRHNGFHDRTMHVGSGFGYFTGDGR